MNNQCAVGVFDETAKMNRALDALVDAGIPIDQISIVAKHIDPDSKVGRELSMDDDSLREAAIGAGLGGAIGIIADVTLIAVAGVGSIIFTGPLAIATGAIVGGYLGALAGSGAHHYHIEQYEKLIQTGRKLVVVDGTAVETNCAASVFERHDAESVHTHATTAGDESIDSA
jgi:hypothetical protein